MDLVCVFGPPAVGKMTVGREIARLCGFKLFHNHLTVEPILEIFEFGTPSFVRLVGEMRRRVVEEAVAADLPGLVFTFVWALENEGDAGLIGSLVDIVEAGGGSARFVELAATFEERKRRNVTELRREHKRTHRDAELSDRILHDLERYVLNSDPAAGPAALPMPAAALLAERPYVRVDNTELSPEEAALRVVAELDLARPSSDVGGQSGDNDRARAR